MKEYDSPIQAELEGSYCNFQLDFSFELPSIPIPVIPIPDLDLDFATILECPLD